MQTLAESGRLEILGFEGQQSQGKWALTRFPLPDKKVGGGCLPSPLVKAQEGA